jgi:hypothetical protein
MQNGKSIFDKQSYRPALRDTVQWPKKIKEICETLYEAKFKFIGEGCLNSLTME